MDGHHYLHLLSVFSPPHIKTSIPYSQALRVSRICSSGKDFRTHVSQMKEWFLARGYPEIVANNQIDKVIFDRDQSLKKNLESGIPFVTIYQSKVKELGTYFLFYMMMEKFKRLSHLLQSYLTEVREK